jgi:hypothetical protein
MQLERAIEDAMGARAGSELYEAMVADDAAVQMNEDEAALAHVLSRGSAYDVVAGWVAWQASGSVDRQTAAESLERTLRAVVAAAMVGYAAAE